MPSELGADEHMQPLPDSLEALKDEFAADPDITDTIDLEIKNTQEWVANRLAEEDESGSKPTRVFSEVESYEQSPLPARSIFDDIDE